MLNLTLASGLKYALSINGGGLRGILPCSVLAGLEEQTGKLSRELFSYVSGTSTGALIAAGVAAGIPAKDLLTVYTTQSKYVFQPTGPLAQMKRVALGYMYDPRNLMQVLVRVFGSHASTWNLNTCPIGVCLPAVAMDGHDWFFTRDTALNSKTTGTVRLLDAAVASACAPTYFGHWPITVGGKQLFFFDGGAGGAANPAYQTCVEMFDYDSFTPSGTRLVCLGTGFSPGKDTPPDGFVQTIQWVTEALVDTSMDWVDVAVRRQWPGVAVKCDWPLPHDIAMDDLGAIPLLLELGKQAASEMKWDAVLQ